MMLLAALLCLGAVHFTAEDMPGVRASAVDPNTGITAVNYRHGDFDGDGLQDLLMAGEVWFQREGRFPLELRTELPLPETPAVLDLWGDRVYAVSASRLAVLAWEGDSWVLALDQPMEWTIPPWFGMQQLDQRAFLERYLHDLTGDGVAEVIFPLEDGLHVHTQDGDVYAKAARLALFPPLSLAVRPADALWPPRKRTLTLATRQMACTVSLETGGARVLVREDLQDGLIRYHETRYRLSKEDGLGIDPASTVRTTTRPMPDFMGPCQLNDEGAVHYVGGAQEVARSRVLPAPVYEICATTDGGETMTRVRTPAFRPMTWFVDYNGNGRLDMVTHRTDLFDGGLRESLDQLVTRAGVRHTVSFHLQSASGDIPRAPGVSLAFPIAFRNPPVAYCAMFRAYTQGNLVNVSGDFNGDGYKDVAVRDRHDGLSIYLTDGRAFRRDPVRIGTPHEDWSFAVADVNANGRADIILRWYDETRTERVQVLFAEEASP